MKLILIGIIPILLLIGLSTSVVINSNLINSASKMESSIEEINSNLINSVSKMESSIEESYQEELEFEGISIGNTTYNSVEEYIDSANSNY